MPVQIPHSFAPFVTFRPIADKPIGFGSVSVRPFVSPNILLKLVGIVTSWPRTPKQLVIGAVLLFYVCQHPVSPTERLNAIVRAEVSVANVTLFDVKCQIAFGFEGSAALRVIAFERMVVRVNGHVSRIGT